MSTQDRKSPDIDKLAVLQSRLAALEAENAVMRIALLQGELAHLGNLFVQLLKSVKIGQNQIILSSLTEGDSKALSISINLCNEVRNNITYAIGQLAIAEIVAKSVSTNKPIAEI
jgi:hypothetical protein